MPSSEFRIAGPTECPKCGRRTDRDTFYYMPPCLKCRNTGDRNVTDREFECKLIQEVLHYLANHYDPEYQDQGKLMSMGEFVHGTNTASYLRRLDPEKIWDELFSSPALEDAIHEQFVDGQ